MPVLQPDVYSDIGAPYLSDIHPSIIEGIIERTGFPLKPHTCWLRVVSGAGTSIMSGLQKGTFGSFSTTTDFTEAHLGEDKTPLPGIESVNVVYKGDFGSVRQATIEWKCWGVKALSRLSPHFLNPGMSVLLEWGWTNAESIQHMYPADAFEHVAANFNDNSGFRQKIYASRGSYDGMLGIITDFSCTGDGKGGFNCSTIITTVGDLAFGITLPRQRLLKGAVEEGSEVLEQIRTFIKEDLVDHLVANAATYGPLFQEAGTVLAERFIAWGLFEHIINERLKIVCGESTPLIFLDSSHVKVSNHPVLLSTNLSVCFVPNGIAVDGVSFSDYYDQSRNGVIPKAVRNSSLYDATDRPRPTTGTSDPMSGYISNLYVNLSYITDAFEVAEKLDEVIINILNGCNEELGRIWRPKIKFNEEKGCVQIVDLNYTNEPVDTFVQDTFTIPSYGPQSAVRDLSVETKLNNEIILGMALAKRYPDREYNELSSAHVRLFERYTTTDRYMGSLEDGTTGQPVQPGALAVSEEELTVERPGLWERVGQWIRNEITTPLVFRGLHMYLYQKKREFLRAELYTDEGNPRNNMSNNVVIPLEATITLDGISGFRVGNCFRLDNLPPEYKEQGTFTLTNMSHQIGLNGWTTTLTAKYRVRTTDNPIADGIPTALAPVRFDNYARGDAALADGGAYPTTPSGFAQPPPGIFLRWPIAGYNTSEAVAGLTIGSVRGGGSRRHQGLDIMRPINTPVLAAGDGVVVPGYVGWGGGNSGNRITIRHTFPDGTVLYTRYLHLQRILVTGGQTVTAGQQIALSGNTGIYNGTSGADPHLHFEVRTSRGLADSNDAHAINPLAICR